MGGKGSSSSSSSTSASSFFRPLRSAARRRDYNNEPTHLLLLPSTIHLLQPTSDKQTNARDPTNRMTRDGAIRRARAKTVYGVYRLLLATRSSSSFFLMAYELEDPLAALASSSARHSEMDLTLWKADSRVCTRRRSGDRFDERLGGDKRYQRA